jgi:hypothetical protein
MKKIIFSLLFLNSFNLFFAQSKVQKNSNQIIPKSDSITFDLKKDISTNPAESESKDFNINIYKIAVPVNDKQVDYRPRETNELIRNVGKYSPANTGDMILKATLNSLPKLKFKL